MWTIAQHTDTTSGAVTWQVRPVSDPDQLVAGGMLSRDQAVAEVGRLLAAALVAAPGDAPKGRRFRATYTEGVETRDGGGFSRVIDPGATNFDRPVPIPLMATDETTWGHDGAVLVGAITTARRDGDTTVVLEGRFDVSPRAVEFARLVDDGMLTRHSPDLGADTTEFECTEYDDEWGWCDAGVLHFTDATLLGSTIVPFPALDDAMIELLDDVDDEGDADADGDDQAETVAASSSPSERMSVIADGIAEGLTSAVTAAATIARPEAPFPADWFADPQLGATDPGGVDADGRVRLRVALFGTCHIGMPDVCTTPPRSATGYAYAHTAPAVELDNGERLRVGHLTVGTGHAPTTGVTAQAAAGHYDDTGFSAALVRFGEDEHGIWAAGVVDPNASDEQVWALRVAALSGDWRRIDGNLELVAVLAVNTPGFPVPDVVAASAAGECTALVAAGARYVAHLTEDRPTPPPPASIAPFIAVLQAARDETRDHARRIHQLERLTNMLTPVLVAQLDAQVKVNDPRSGRHAAASGVNPERSRALPAR